MSQNTMVPRERACENTPTPMLRLGVPHLYTIHNHRWKCRDTVYRYCKDRTHITQYLNAPRESPYKTTYSPYHEPTWKSLLHGFIYRRKLHNEFDRGCTHMSHHTTAPRDSPSKSTPRACARLSVTPRPPVDRWHWNLRDMHFLFAIGEIDAKKCTLQVCIGM